MSVHFNAFQFVESEKALSLFNSKGKEQGRIHLFKYDGDEHKDRYAIAAERIEFGAGELPSLGWLDRKFYVLMQDHDGTTYKVNRNSFEKRTGIDLNDYADAETGVCSDTLDTVLGDRAAELAKWNAKTVNMPNYLNTTFIKNLFQSFLSAKISADMYQDVYFYSVGEDLPSFAPLSGTNPHLVIRYGVSEIAEPDEVDPSVRIVNIWGDEYKNILKGHPASEEILTEINYFAADLELMRDLFNEALDIGFINAKLILQNEEQHVFDSYYGEFTLDDPLANTKQIQSAQLILKREGPTYPVYTVKNHESTIHYYADLESLAEGLGIPLTDLEVLNQ